MPRPGIEIFAVEDTALQLCWRALPPGPVTVEAGDVSVEGLSTGTPGGLRLTGLPADAAVDVHVRAGRRRYHAGRVRTLPSPPGRELYRFATVNDVHIGELAFGYLRTMREREPRATPYPERCVRAAIAEAKAWGAQRLVVKGDVTEHGTEDEWDVAGRLLAAARLPVDIVLGNHDVKRKAGDANALLGRHGLAAEDWPRAIDVPGLRIVTVATAKPAKGPGYVFADERAEAARLVGDAAGAAFVAMHHYPQRWRVPTMWPPGISGPMAKAFLDAVARANPATLVASGHSHRHRRHHHRVGGHSITVAEIGSTKDYPGAWAGYVVHEGGIRQVVHRLTDPDAMAWTEYTRWALGGAWGRWAPGLRSHRCFTLIWPPR